MLYNAFLIHIYSVLVSWENGNISGKLMEFDSRIRLETLVLVSYLVRGIQSRGQARFFVYNI